MVLRTMVAWNSKYPFKPVTAQAMKQQQPTQKLEIQLPYTWTCLGRVSPAYASVSRPKSKVANPSPIRAMFSRCPAPRACAHQTERLSGSMFLPLKWWSVLGIRVVTDRAPCYRSAQRRSVQAPRHAGYCVSRGLSLSLLQIFSVGAVRTVIFISRTSPRPSATRGENRHSSLRCFRICPLRVRVSAGAMACHRSG